MQEFLNTIEEFTICCQSRSNSLFGTSGPKPEKEGHQRMGSYDTVEAGQARCWVKSEFLLG